MHSRYIINIQLPNKEKLKESFSVYFCVFDKVFLSNQIKLIFFHQGSHVSSEELVSM